MVYLYGVTDEKYVQPDVESGQKKLKPLDTYKFRLNWLLEGKQKISPYEASICYKVSPDTLVETLSPKVNGILLPKPFQWRTLDVSDWIGNLGFPQYRNTFVKNFIHGRTLIRMDASNLVKINIKDFDHIKLISKFIRSLYGFKKSSFNRSISMPKRAPHALYKFFRVHNGPKYERTRRTDLFRGLPMLRPPLRYETHWTTLERWLKHLRPVDTELIGGSNVKRYNMYRPKSKPKLLDQKKVNKPCNCVPPCMCNWTKEKDLREPWKLKCLEKVAEQKKPKDECTCYEPCTCGWIEQHIKYVKILRVKIPNKYANTKRISVNPSSRVRVTTKGFFFKI